MTKHRGVDIDAPLTFEQMDNFVELMKLKGKKVTFIYAANTSGSITPFTTTGILDRVEIHNIFSSSEKDYMIWLDMQVGDNPAATQQQLSCRYWKLLKEIPLED